MPVTDSISDFLTRIRNAGAAKHKYVNIPFSGTKLAIAKILKEQGYIIDFEKVEDSIQGSIKVSLRYHNKEHAIKEMIRISRPGRRLYLPADKLPRVRNGLGIAIISTSKGVMSDKAARSQNIGGEIICSIW
ncbi:MAG: ribosomal protein [Ignavibacteria bacterium]|nr:ribosomal protein [Ignavibacteria bacterium]